LNSLKRSNRGYQAIAIGIGIGIAIEIGCRILAAMIEIRHRFRRVRMGLLI